MTKFERIIYEEQQEAIRKSLREDEKRIARNFLIKGISPVDIAESTGLELSEVEKLAEEIKMGPVLV